MTHKCPKCGKRWQCFTDAIFNAVIDKELCDLPNDSECYECAGTMELKKQQDEIVEHLRRTREKGEIAGL